MGSTYATLVRCRSDRLRDSLGSGDLAVIDGPTWERLRRDAVQEQAENEDLGLELPEELATTHAALKTLLGRGASADWAAEAMDAAAPVLRAYRALTRSLGEAVELELGYLGSGEPEVFTDFVFRSSGPEPAPIPIDPGGFPRAATHASGEISAWCGRVAAAPAHAVVPEASRGVLLAHLERARDEGQDVWVFYWGG